MYKIGICDDGQNTCSLLETMILNYLDKSKLRAEIEIWYTGEGLCDYLKRGNQIDILFLDIVLEKINGIDVGQYIRNDLQNRNIQIIYISGKTSYALKLFKTQPMDFLVKPITQPQINDVLELAIKILGLDAKNFKYKFGKSYFNIPFGDIMYFVSDNRKIQIISPNKRNEFYGKLKDIEKRLPKDFITIHQSYIVNEKYIKRYTYEDIELTDGTMLTISKGNRKRIRERILKEG